MDMKKVKNLHNSQVYTIDNVEEKQRQLKSHAIDLAEMRKPAVRKEKLLIYPMKSSMRCKTSEKFISLMNMTRFKFTRITMILWHCFTPSIPLPHLLPPHFNFSINLLRINKKFFISFLHALFFSLARWLSEWKKLLSSHCVHTTMLE